MKSILTTLSIGSLALLVVSCGPLIVNAPPVDNNLPQVKVDEPTSTGTTSTKKTPPKPNKTVSSRDQKEIRNQIPPVPETTSTRNISTPEIPREVNSTPIALPIPGKPGYVYNPFNNNPVYVEGIPSGKTVLDPADPNKEHKFRVP